MTQPQIHPNSTDNHTNPRPRKTS